MKFQPKANNRIQGNDAMAERVEAMTDLYLEPFRHGPTGTEVHLSGASGGKHCSYDTHCATEARLRNQQPVGVSPGDASVEKTLRRAVTNGFRPKGVPAEYRPRSRARIGVVFPFVAALLLLAGRAGATDFADQTISTDRPGIPYGTLIVPTGHLQLETGLPTFENDPLPGGHNLLLSTPTYLRYGVSDDFEVQLASSPWNRRTTTQDGRRHSVSGAGDLQLGGKFALTPGGGGVPAITLIGYVTVPTGNRNFSNGRAAYNLNAVASWSLTGNTGLTTMASFTQAPADGDRHANSGTFAVSLSHSFTSRLSAYAETGWFPGYTNTSSTALAGGGMTYLLTRHVQLDGFFDLGLNHASPTSVFGTGFSILF